MVVRKPFLQHVCSHGSCEKFSAKCVKISFSQKSYKSRLRFPHIYLFIYCFNGLRNKGKIWYGYKIMLIIISVALHEKQA